MLQIAGFKPDDPVRKSKYATLVHLYQKYADYKISPCDSEWQEFMGLVEKLMADTITNATAVCATIAGAADRKFTNSYSDAELIVVDEASRIPEYHWWPLLAFYPKAVGKIMVGDPFQLPPRIDEFPGMRNPCQLQLEMSLQERAQRNGIPSAFFTVQFRAMPEIAEVYSKVCYQSRLISDESTHLSRRKTAEKLVKHNDAIYGIKEPIVFFDVPEARQSKDGKSMCCERYGNLVLLILENLLRAGFGSEILCKIAILTPYKAQLRKYWVAKNEFSSMAAKDVSLETADKIQGMEYDIVIVDPVVTHHSGFLTMQRLNVLFSRAKFGLYVVGNCEAWSRMKGDNAEWVREFGRALLKHKVSLPEDQSRGSVVLDIE